MNLNFFATLVLILVKCPLLFGVLTHHWHLRSSSIDNIGRIVGGHDAKLHSHPYLVSLQLRFLWVHHKHFCAGTLIKTNWILTAGHCIKLPWYVRWLPVDAVAGIHQIKNVDANTQVITVAERISHPLYNGGIAKHDIGVLRTTTPFDLSPAIQLAYLPKSIDVDTDPLQLSGWGRLSTTLFIPDLPDNLQEVSVDYIPYDECYKAFETKGVPRKINPLDQEANICTGPLTGGISGCSGDSGGPLIKYVNTRKYYGNENSGMYMENENNEEYDGWRIKNDKLDGIPVVIGVVSWGFSPCGQEGAPTIFTNVSNYLDFIHKYIDA